MSKNKLMVTLSNIQLQEGTENTYFVTWTFSKHSKTDHYEVKWTYWTQTQKTEFVGSDSTSKAQIATYTPPSNARKIAVKVKPVPKSTGSGKKAKKEYTNADWCRPKEKDFYHPTLEKPSAPTVEISNSKLTVSCENYETDAVAVDFQIISDDSTLFASRNNIKLTYNRVVTELSINVGHRYKARVRWYDSYGNASEWSEFSSNVETIPGSVTTITSIETIDKSTVKLSWTPAANATGGYEIEYTYNQDYFNTAPSEVQSQSDYMTTTGLVFGIDTSENKNTWFFRVRAKNNEGEGGWSNIRSVPVGTVPEAPTTWSYTAAVSIGETIVLNWSHNSEDGSTQTAAEIKLTANDVERPIVTISGDTTSYEIDTSTGFDDGTILYWEVRTKGAVEKFGEWSTKRQISIYAPANVVVGVYKYKYWLWDTFEFDADTTETALSSYLGLTSTITAFPFYIQAIATPDTQSALSFVLSITADNTYETDNDFGQTIVVSRGDEVYSKYFAARRNTLNLTLNPGDLHLENGMSYTIHISVAMNSGLTAENTYQFNVDWDTSTYDPTAYIYVDPDTLIASIQPYCEDDEDQPVTDVFFSVYRREYDGTFTEIATDIDGELGVTVQDPHPSLDYARYRIVSRSKTTGDITYTDMPGEPVNCGAVVIQWDEDWVNFDYDIDMEPAEPVWSGSMVKVPYNIDVSINRTPDVSLVEYIGREHPVSYYGTQKGDSATWKFDVPKSDIDTIYQLRRLSAYSGDVYVREPSGTGYWANVSLSESQAHNKMIVPISMKVTRVEGGA